MKFEILETVDVRYGVVNPKRNVKFHTPHQLFTLPSPPLQHTPCILESWQLDRGPDW